MYCIIITYMYKFDDYEEDKYEKDYEIFFHNTENDCELRFMSVKSKLMEQYYYELNENDIKYTIHEVPHKDEIF